MVASVGEVTKLTGGKLDYLIANAGFISDWSSLFSLGKLGQSPKELEDDLIYSFKVNAVGPVHLFNLYLPLILKGDAKKAIAITSGMADLDLINDYRIDVAVIAVAIEKPIGNGPIDVFKSLAG
ncbi:Short chain dehydrogenase virK like protein [Verticillium longisporum]|nr:Short chain dehydrogenase virK like protein [Verticillium longisporum]